MSIQSLQACKAGLCGAWLQASTAGLGFGPEYGFLTALSQQLTVLLLAFVASLVTQHLPQTVPAISSTVTGTWQKRCNGVAGQCGNQQGHMQNLP